MCVPPLCCACVCVVNNKLGKFRLQIALLYSDSLVLSSRPNSVQIASFNQLSMDSIVSRGIFALFSSFVSSSSSADAEGLILFE